MLDNNYILKRSWQSKSGVQEELYLGYDNQNYLDCISDVKKAKAMIREECEEFKTILQNSKVWVIDILPEDFAQEETKTIEENNNAEQ